VGNPLLSTHEDHQIAVDQSFGHLAGLAVAAGALANCGLIRSSLAGLADRLVANSNIRRDRAIRLLRISRDRLLGTFRRRQIGRAAAA
jgi:hypothetical protein